MPANLRDISSPFKGKPLWEPDEEEWPDLNATQVSSTYKATFKDPKDPSPLQPPSPGPLSRFTTTLTSFLPTSASKLASEARLREEEQQRDNLEELTNTYYSSPTGDLHDTIISSVHLPGSRYFPTHSSNEYNRDGVRVPHVIDLERYFTAQDPLLEAAYPRLGDAIATILSHTNRECIEAFLDPRVDEFVYRREVDRSAAGNILVVRRKGCQVIAGSYRNLGFSLSWTLYVKASFSATGRWYETFASPVASSSPIVNGVPAWDTFLLVHTPFSLLPASSDAVAVRTTDTEPRKIVLATPPLYTKGLKEAKEDEEQRHVETEDISPTDEKFVLYQSRALARYLLKDIWVRFEGRYECKATWEVDGVVKEVRLKRAIVGFAGQDEDDE